MDCRGWYIGGQIQRAQLQHCIVRTQKRISIVSADDARHRRRLRDLLTNQHTFSKASPSPSATLLSCILNSSLYPTFTPLHITSSQLSDHLAPTPPAAQIALCRPSRTPTRAHRSPTARRTRPSSGRGREECPCRARSAGGTFCLSAGLVCCTCG